ncbi:MAG TPA: tetratricopeptide repeat protein [Rhizomicrobium sp.]
MKRLRLSVPVLVAALVLLPLAAHAEPSAFDQATQLELDGMDLMQKGDLDGAITKYRQAVQIYPKSKAFRQNLAEALNNAGVAKYQAKDYPAAISDFQEALANVPNFAQAKTNLALAQGDQFNAEGLVLFKAGDFAGAVQKFNEALVAEPGYKNAIVNRDAAEAEIALKNGDLATAVAKLQEAVSIASTPFLQNKLETAQAALAAQQEAAQKAQQKTK